MRFPLRASPTASSSPTAQEVKLVFSEGGLVIMTTGAALQDGSIGDIVRVRNSDSGVTVSGSSSRTARSG